MAKRSIGIFFDMRQFTTMRTRNADRWRTGWQAFCKPGNPDRTCNITWRGFKWRRFLVSLCHQTKRTRIMKTKKDIITEIENVFSKDPNKEIDIRNTGVSFVNKRYGLHGTILCLVEGTIMVRLNKDSNVYWKANLSERKKEELVSLMTCIGKDWFFETRVTEKERSNDFSFFLFRKSVRQQWIGMRPEKSRRDSESTSSS